MLKKGCQILAPFFYARSRERLNRRLNHCLNHRLECELHHGEWHRWFVRRLLRQIREVNKSALETRLQAFGLKPVKQIVADIKPRGVRDARSTPAAFRSLNIFCKGSFENSAFSPPSTIGSSRG